MKKYIFTVSFIVLIILLLNVPMLNKFTISNGKTGEIVYIDDTDNAREFVVSFRHSVNRTPVNEFIKVQGNKFVVYKTTFYSYGAGMPEYDAQSKQKVTIDNGLVQIENIDTELENFTYMVGTYADHTLSYEDKSMKLSELVEPQKPAFFSITRVTPFELIKYLLRRI
ncbi:MAG: hypothetical protein APF77_18755 [Clostridia bacterium BRH_c25]|nr:MAG: hypothetical protein APF77_18755 [Clostridia bacterium BRH_c25]